MKTLEAGQIFPKTEIARLGGGTLTLGEPSGTDRWQLVVIYRGLHCPLCKKYLARLEQVKSRLHDNGIGVVIASGDPEEKAQAMADEISITVPVGYGLTIEQMRSLGLYVSTPRGPQETDQPFPEPGIFVVNNQGKLHIIDISNAPFSRPDLDALAGGLEFIRANDYPIRGAHAA